jgi:CubicO group peptidase (beta-lactamase class C family)
MKKSMPHVVSWGMVAWLFCAGGALSAGAGQEEQCLENEISRVIQPFIDHDLFQGRVLVGKNGKIVFNRGYGFANMEWGIPSRPETKGKPSKSRY